jgi:class 3 adenylate cyclase/tetratricopeptide (TPR) repeat protein
MPEGQGEGRPTGPAPELAASPERSIVTVLVADTVDSTDHIAGVDPDEAERFLDPIIRHVGGAVRQAGGMLMSFSGDGGVAVFGWPDSQEDHADRACEAAWLIQQPAFDAAPLCDANGRPVRFRVGVHSGLVGLRQLDIGFGSRVDTVGSTVHIAAALEKRAPPDGILISSRTRELCRSELALQPFEDLPVLQKIKARVFRLLTRPGRPEARDILRSYQIPLIGRSAEREVLRKAQSQPFGDKRAVGIIGEPGIGKSRLAAAAIEDAEASGLPVLIFHCDSRKRTTPYAAIRSLILGALSVSETASDEEIAAALGTSGAEKAGDGLGAVLFFGRTDGGDHISRLTPTQVARTLVETLTKILASKAPGLIVVEDIHQLDPESMNCLKLLADASGTCSLLLTGRPETSIEMEHVVGTLLRLDSLPREDMKELARRLWPGTEPPANLIERAIDRADGVPFVLEQIILSLASDGADDARLLPESVESVIHARMNRLSAVAKSAAQALSLLGEEVETDLALRTLGLDAETFRSARSELERLEIIHASTEASIRFRHTIVADACAEMLPGTRRKEIHRAALEALRALHADLGPYYERLAFHAEGAQDDGTALEYLWLAALQARRSSAISSLYLLFERAMRCIERIGEPAEPRFVDFTLMVFAQMLQIGEFTRMNAYLPRTMELAEKQNRPDKVCAALCHMAMVCWFEGRYAEALRYGETASAMARAQEHVPLIFASQLMVANALHGMGAMERAIALLGELCEMLTGELRTARLGATAIPSSMARGFMSWFVLEVGRYALGLSYAEEALDIAVSAGDAYSEVLARLALGRCLIMLKRDDEAQQCLSAALETSERNGYDAIKPNLVGHLATALSRCGRAEEAVRMVEAWLRHGHEKRTGRLELFHLDAGYGEALFRSGATASGLAAIDRAVEAVRGIDSPSRIAQGVGLRARLRSEIEPDSPLVASDLAEERVLCRQFGLAAWR